MEKYIKIDNDFFEILIPDSMKEYGNQVMSYSTDKFKQYLNFFKKDGYGEKIKSSFFITREDFFNRLNELEPESNPPSWAQGSFCGGEIQILLDLQNIYNRFCTLAHETFHLLFKKFIFQENNFERLVWLDEALAVNFDGTTEKAIENGKFLEIVLGLKNNKNLPKMNELSFDKGNIKTKDYNGYDLFMVVGRYLVETKNQNALLEYVNDMKRVIADGNSILEISLKYFLDKYNLE